MIRPGDLCQVWAAVPSVVAAEPIALTDRLDPDDVVLGVSAVGIWTRHVLTCRGQLLTVDSDYLTEGSRVVSPGSSPR